MEKIADSVNVVGVALRTIAEVREKWRNLHSQAKKEFSELTKEQKKTGGGPAPKMLSALTAKVIDIFKEHLLSPASRVLSPLVRINILTLK